MSREEEESEENGGPYYDQPNLGDLTRGISWERGEAWDQNARRLPPAQPPGQGGGLPGQTADLARGQDIKDVLQRERISKVAPALAYQVISTYDARPVQGYDFHASECNVLDWRTILGVTEFADVSITFLVPDNTIAVLRTFQYQVTNAPLNHVTEGECWLASTLLVNDLPVRQYNAMFHPVRMARPFPAFVIADERTRIKLTLSVGKMDNGDPVEFFGDLDGILTPVLLRLYGNIILKTGVPIEFEIANKI